MYASLYKIPQTSILDNRKFIDKNSIIYEAPPKVNKYVPDETIEEKVNYSYGPNLKDRGAEEIYSYRYDANYRGNRDSDSGVASILDADSRTYLPVSIIQTDRLGKNKPDAKGNVKETYQEASKTKAKANVKVSVSGDSKEGGSCSADSDGVKNICGSDKLFPILDPRFNLREAAKNMILLEDHLFQLGKRCQDCILKHCLTIEGFLEEGVTLDIKCEYTQAFQKAFDDFRLIFIEIGKKIKDGSLTNEDCLKIAQDIRKIRKPLCQNFATFM